MSVFFPLNKEKHPTLQSSNWITCKNNEQEQQSTCGAAWPAVGKDPFPWAVLAAQGMLWAWLYARGYSTAAHHARDTGAAACGAVCPGSVTCQIRTLRQEQSAGAGISYVSFASGRNQSQRYTLGKKELQVLYMSSPSLPALGREQLLLKKRSFIFCHVRCHGFFPPRPYPSYYRSKLAGKKCWQLGVPLP